MTYTDTSSTARDGKQGLFTLDVYASLLERTAKRFAMRGFDVLSKLSFPDRFCILRHDIDMSPQAALRLARLEASKGIRSTYTVLLTGPYYSPFEKQMAGLLREIGLLGHRLGLHFDAAWHEIDDEGALDKEIAHEAQILRRLLPGIPVECFSFHNTSHFTMSACADSYGGLWNAHAKRLQDEVPYVSDSNGYWRFHSWEDMLGKDLACLQVLTHPEWWQETDLPPAEKLCRILEERTRNAWQDYVSHLSSAGRSIVSGFPALLAAVLGELDEPELMRLWLGGEEIAAYLKLLRLLRAEAQSSGEAGDVLEEHRSTLEQLLGEDVPDARCLSESFQLAAHRLIEFRRRPATVSSE